LDPARRAGRQRAAGHGVGGRDYVRRETREGLVYAQKVFAGVRMGLLMLGLVSVALVPLAPPVHPVSVPGWIAHPMPDPGWQNVFTAWERFDGLWFLRIAAEGYRSADGSAAFFPLYPLVTRAVSFLIGGHPFAAALIVSNASFAGALCMLYVLTASEISDRVARTTVLFVSLFPTSFFFVAPYSESLFLLLAVTAFWGARTRRWAIAGIAGALAALTRNVGIVLAPALLVEAVHQRLERRGSMLPGVAASAAVGLGTLSYLGYWAARTGDWLAPIHEQADWERVATWPWMTLVKGTEYAFRYVGNTNGGYWLIDWLVVVPMLVASAWALFRFRPSYCVYVWASLLVPLSYVFRDRPLMSMPRFVLPLFPAFWALAEAADWGRIPRTAVVAVGAASLGLLTLLFVNWYYIF
jgi:Gpi18-like mannosyltransferase